MPIPKPIKIVPNIERVLIKLLTQKDLMAEVNILAPGQLKAGENLLYGEVIDGGKEWIDDKGNTRTPRFKAGDRVYYSEYSASALFRIGSMGRGELTYGEAMREENKLYAVAEDDIMAYEEEGQQYVSKTKIEVQEKGDKKSNIVV